MSCEAIPTGIKYETKSSDTRQRCTEAPCLRYSADSHAAFRLIIFLPLPLTYSKCVPFFSACSLWRVRTGRRTVARLLGLTIRWNGACLLVRFGNGGCGDTGPYRSFYAETKNIRKGHQIHRTLSMHRQRQQLEQKQQQQQTLSSNVSLLYVFASFHKMLYCAKMLHSKSILLGAPLTPATRRRFAGIFSSLTLELGRMRQRDALTRRVTRTFVISS